MAVKFKGRAKMVRIQDTTLHEQNCTVKVDYKYPLGECGRKAKFCA